jgi:hypothetical protein
MLAEDLTIVDNGALGTNIGSTGSRAFARVFSTLDGTTQRRYAAGANTDRMEFLIRHSQTGKGFAARTLSNIKWTYTKVNQDTSTTGGIIPTASVNWSLNRPTNMASITTDALMTSLTAYLVALLTTSGNMARFYNLES